MKKKKLLSLALAVTMLFGSVAALPEGVFSDSASISASAEADDDYVYRILDDGTVEISGYMGEKITLTIPKTINGYVVSSIGNNAFSNSMDERPNCAKIEGVIIPDSVTRIGDEAFASCTNLESIIIPNNVISIGQDVFSCCEKLSSVTIGSGVLYIGNYAFYNCKSLTRVTIPSSVTSIGDNAFSRCTKLHSINVDNYNLTYSSKDGILYNKNMAELIKCPEGKKGDIAISYGVEIIFDEAFKNSLSLNSIYIPRSVSKIGCSVFSCCTQLKTITVDKNNKYYTSIDGVLYNKKCTELLACPCAKKSISINDSVTKLNRDAFSYCTNLSSISIPNRITDLEKKCFESCNNLENISVNEDNPYYSSYGGILYNKKMDTIIIVPRGIKAIELPNSIKGINDDLFCGLKLLKSVVVPNSVTYIGDRAFDCCNSLSSVTLSNRINIIGDSAFNECTSLISIVIPNSVTHIGENAFAKCEKLKSIILGNKVDNIDRYAFINCNNLKSITIPKSVKYIGYNAFGYIYDSSSQTSNKVIDFVIKCYKGTEGEKYAKSYNFEYEFVFDFIRIAGINRFSTATEISKEMFDNSKSVILAFGLNYADALAGVPLAEKLNAPILLTHTKTLPDETLAEIKRLGAKEVIILGGEGAINKDVEKTLKKNGLKIKRIAGQSRFGTATAIANELNKAPEELFFVYGLNSADALSVGGVAAAKGAPIIYLTTDGKLNADTEAYLKTVKGKVKNAYIIGGDGVISNAMMKNVATALGLKVGSTVQRVAGKNRYETCVAVNKKFKSVLSSDGICVAKGLDFPDALAGGVYAAKNKQALFLADGKKLQDVQSTYLKSKNASKITVFGGTGAVPDDLVKLIAKASV